MHTAVAEHPRHDRASWGVRWAVDKYADDAAFAAGHVTETVEGEGNILVNAGIALLEDLLIGAGGTVYSNANAYIGVGDSTTAAAAGQTDLQAASNKLRKAMDATYPSRSGQTLTFRSTFGSSDANFAWEEWAVFNASTSGTMLNRKVAAMGTKASGATWVFTVTITIS